MSNDKKVDCDNYSKKLGCKVSHPMNFCHMMCSHEDNPEECLYYTNYKKILETYKEEFKD